MSDPGARILREEAVRWVAPEVGEPAGAARPAAPMTVDRLEALQRSAYEEAYAQGLEAGRQEGLQQVLERVERLDECLMALAEPFCALDEEVEKALVDLAVKVARQIVRRELKTDPGQIVGVVRETIELLPVASRNIEVHLHPEDAAVVRSAFGDANRNLAWTIVEDPVLSRGGLQVITETSQIDARVEHRLENILAALTGGEREEDD